MPVELKSFSIGTTGFQRDLSIAKSAGKEGWGLSRVIISPGLLEKEFGIKELPPKGRELTYYGIPVEIERRWEGVCYKIVWEERNE